MVATIVRSPVIEIELTEFIKESVKSQMAIVEERIEAQDKMSTALREAARRAIDKSETQMDDRLHVMNQFRESLRDQANTFAVKETVEAIRVELGRQIEDARVNSTKLSDDRLSTTVARITVTERLVTIIQQQVPRFERQESRLDIIEKLIANWQGRLVVIGGVWAVVVIVISALFNFALRHST